ncbi:MAG: serine hydrolase domain-containing protein [Bacillota bacterium]
MIDKHRLKKFMSTMQGGVALFKESEQKEVVCTGYRDLTNEIPINKNTSFQTASAGKFFVAVGIMKLIEDNRLSLDSKLGDVVDFSLNEIDGDVTVKELLTHTSGVPDYFDESSMEDYSDLWKDFPNYKIRCSKALLPLFRDKPMAFEPGTRFEYCDSGFVLLGLIIEAITNKVFDHYLKEILFRPLKMTHTGYYELDRLPGNCANAYVRDSNEAPYHTNIYSVDVKGTGAGGAFTSVLDVERFWQGLLRYKVLNKESVAMMLARHVDLGTHGYGLGVWLDENNNPYFQGVDPGVTFMSGYNLDTHTELTLISNYEDDIFSVYREIKSAINNA